MYIRNPEGMSSQAGGQKNSLQGASGISVDWRGQGATVDAAALVVDQGRCIMF
jgi:hypothetical protein